MVAASVLGQAVDHLSITLEKKDCSCLVAVMEVARGGGDGGQQQRRMRTGGFQTNLPSMFFPQLGSSISCRNLVSASCSSFLPFLCFFLSTKLPDQKPPASFASPWLPFLFSFFFLSFFLFSPPAVPGSFAVSFSFSSPFFLQFGCVFSASYEALSFFFSFHRSPPFCLPFFPAQSPFFFFFFFSKYLSYNCLSTSPPS